MDPMRRRLTVSQGGEPVAGKGGKGRGRGDDNIEHLGLKAVFDAATKRAIAIVSETDAQREKKQPFGSKDEIVACNKEIATPASTKQWLQSTVGWTCNKGLKPEACNQDSLSILVVEDSFALYGVYDGHGPNGHDVSAYAAKILPQLFLESLETKDPQAAFMYAFPTAQKKIQEQTKFHIFDAEISGTTCTMAYHDIMAQKIWIAHVGDSRALVGTVGSARCDLHMETIDHKPQLEKERYRIEHADPPGRVVFDGYFNHRVFAREGHYPGLNMSRALGDCLAHRVAGLTAEPDVTMVDLESIESHKDRVLVLCTDGVWEFIESLEALKILEEAGKSKSASPIGVLARQGYDLWMADSDNELTDDITGLLVKLPDRHPAEK